MKELDHAYLNDIFANPTAEAIAQHLADRLREEMQGTAVSLSSLKLWEGKGKWVLID